MWKELRVPLRSQVATPETDAHARYRIERTQSMTDITDDHEPDQTPDAAVDLSNWTIHPAVAFYQAHHPLGRPCMKLMDTVTRE